MAQSRILGVLAVTVTLAMACADDGPVLTLTDEARSRADATATTAPASTEPPSTATTPDTTGPSTTNPSVPSTEPPPTGPVPPEPRPCRSAEELADVVPAGFVQLEPVPVPEAVNRVLRREELAEPFLNLGFDVEQDPSPVPALLEVLRSHGIRTTMFIVGTWAEQNPELVRQIRDAGHEIGTHSYSHERMGEWPAGDIVADLERAEVALAAFGVATRPWFRPPHGNYTAASVETAFEAGWTTVRWWDGSDDFVEGTPSEVQDSICFDLLEGAVQGSVLISHTFNPQTPAAVDRFIREMHDGGFVFVPLSVLLAEEPGNYVVMNPD